jgi:hypothetical protein
MTYPEALFFVGKCLTLEHDISPIFLKGTAHLLDGMYMDIGERMVGEIC